MEIYIETNAPDVARRLQELAPYIKQHQIELFGELGELFLADVRKRIQTQDGGSWAEVSKWVRAKKGVDVPLKNADRFVHFRFDSDTVEIYDETDGDWNLSQHDKGFVNKQDSESDGRIKIDIVDPSPLGLSKAGPFMWVAQHGPAHTPARRIWPNETEVRAISLPITSKWLERIITEKLNG